MDLRRSILLGPRTIRRWFGQRMAPYLMKEGWERGWRCRKLPRWFMPACIFILAFFLHASTLRGGFVWDDQPAVVDNRDIWTDSPWGDVWRHDFWGQHMTDAESHKSFRPLATLTFRMSNIVARRAATAAASDKAEGVPVTDRVSPTDADAPGFHLVNVFVHALTCAWSVLLFRGVFSGEELPACVSSLLFTVHPVHVEAVAPIVGRADLLCGLFAVIALSLTVGGAYRGRGKEDPRCCGIITSREKTVSRRRGNQVLKHERHANPSKRQVKTSEGAPTAASSVGHAAKLAEPHLRSVDGNGSEAGLVVSDALTRVTKPPLKVDNTATADDIPDPSCPPDLTIAWETEQSCLRSGSPHVLWGFERAANRKKQLPCRNATVRADSGIGSVTFIAALVFATAATLCKEVGVTVFGLIAFAEVVRFLDESGWGLFNEAPPTTRAGDSGNALASSTSVKMVLRSYRFRSRLLPSVARFSSSLVCAGALVWLHVSLHGGAAVRVWGVLENDIAILPSFKERALSYAYTHAVYASKLLWPDRLCYDWGFRCIPHVTSTTDPAVLAPLTVYAAVIGAAVITISRRDTVVMWGLAFIVVPFVPASNILLPVGAVVAERLLYLPSLGACVLAGRTLSRENTCDNSGYDDPRNRIVDSARSADEGETIPERKGSLDAHECWSSPSSNSRISPRSSLGFNTKDDVTGALQESPVVEMSRTALATLTRSSERSQPQLDQTPAGTEIEGSAVAARLRLLLSTAAIVSDSPIAWRASLRRSPDAKLHTINVFSGGMDAVPCVVASCGGTADCCCIGIDEPYPLESPKRLAGDSPLTQTGGVVTQNGEWIRRRVADGSLRVSIALVLLLSWVAFFAARTVRRCEDWMSDRRLFDSALRVCPDGIKTLNNLAAGMLSVDEADRAEELLTRAVELHPDFPLALFNLGVARMLRENHGGAVTALERSLALEPHSTRTMVYLGLEYFTLTKEALETTTTASQPTWSKQRDVGAHRAHDSETLLSRTETLIDRALAVGSGLPLARLVKGDALILRRQPRLAAGYFRDGIEITHRLLDGGSSSLSGGDNSRGTKRDVRLTDALNLPVAYNRLGLALRDAGSNPIASKEAFLAGLSMAPEDFALLVNGGAEHQAAGDIAGARALYHRALLQHPTSPELLSNLGWLEEESGGSSITSLEKAADLYGRALELIDVGSPARRQVEVNFANVQKRLRRLCESGKAGNCP